MYKPHRCVKRQVEKSERSKTYQLEKRQEPPGKVIFIYGDETDIARDPGRH